MVDRKVDGVEAALRRAGVREVDPGVFFATVPGLEGAWGEGENEMEALEDLREAIVGWLAIRRRTSAFLSRQADRAAYEREPESIDSFWEDVETWGTQ